MVSWGLLGAPAFAVYKEKFTKIEHENRLKETEVVEGGFLDLGFLLYRVRLQVLEKDSDSSIIQSTIEYELAEESAANVSLVSTDSLAAIAEVIGNHLAEEYKAKLNSWDSWEENSTHFGVLALFRVDYCYCHYCGCVWFT